MDKMIMNVAYDVEKGNQRMSDEFNWKDAEDDLVVPSQLAVAVYENPKGSIVIRQEADHIAEDTDSFVVISRTYIPVLIAALQRHIKD